MNALVSFILMFNMVVVVQEPLQVTDWQSPEELVQFLITDDTDKGTWVETVHDCDDFAYQLRDRALAQGRYLSVIYLTPDAYYDIYSCYPVGNYPYHMICMARVGNTLWVVEPQNDDLELMPWGID